MNTALMNGTGRTRGEEPVQRILISTVVAVRSYLTILYPA